jgi:hypothetical protein
MPERFAIYGVHYEKMAEPRMKTFTRGDQQLSRSGKPKDMNGKDRTTCFFCKVDFTADDTFRLCQRPWRAMTKVGARAPGYFNIRCSTIH